MLIVTVKLLCLILTSSTPVEVMPDGPVAEGFQAAQEPTSQEELALYTILSSDSPEELEASLAGGYPTPEIRAILEDESIPEEDRYWLDCRMRSLIAQMLHRFYDREGNIIEVDAEWIVPGELYWQETMMVHPLGEPEEIRADGPSLNFPTKPGELRSLYGDQVGHLAVANRLVRISRDGSIGLLQTGERSWSSGGRMFFAFLYPDGSFREMEMYPYDGTRSDFNMQVSQDGTISAWHAYNRLQEPETSHLLIFDGSGNEIERYELPVAILTKMTVSGDNRYIACSGAVCSGSGIVDRQTGEVMWFSHGTGRSPFFSENSSFCTLTDGAFLERWYTLVVNLHDRRYYRIPNTVAVSEVERGIGSSSISNDGRVFVISNYVYLDGRNILTAEKQLRWNSLSPNGFFGLFYDPSSFHEINAVKSFLVYDLRTLTGR